MPLAGELWPRRLFALPPGFEYTPASRGCVRRSNTLRPSVRAPVDEPRESSSQAARTGGLFAFRPRHDFNGVSRPHERSFAPARNTDLPGGNAPGPAPVPLPKVTDSPFLGLTALIEILKCLKKHGERLDSQLADETGMPLETVRKHVADLEAKGDVIACNLIRFNNGERTDAWLYRVSGYIPPAAPGRKARPAK